MSNLMLPWTNIVAQDDTGFGNLIYLLAFVIIPMLNALGAKIRERYGNKGDETAVQPPPDDVKPKRAKPIPKGRIKPPTRPMETPPPARPAPPIPRRPAAPPPVAIPVPKQKASRPLPEDAVPKPRIRKRARPVPARAVPVRRPDAIQQVSLIPEEESEPKKKPAAMVIQERLRLQIDARSLRTAIVLSELLQPPVALRDHPPGSMRF